MTQNGVQRQKEGGSEHDRKQTMAYFLTRRSRMNT